MHRITVQYAIPQDPESFDAEYVGAHVPLVMPIPGLASFTWSKPQPMGGEATVYLVAELNFPDLLTLQAALQSPEMAAASAHAAGLGVPATSFIGEVIEATV